MKTSSTPQTCSHCRGTGWLVDSEKEGSPAKPCPHCRGARRVEIRLSKAGIPPRFLDRGFEDFQPISRSHSRAHRLQAQALERAIEFVEAFPETEGGLLFVGPCGVGKTHLSVAVLRAVIQEKAATGRFVDETELMRRLQYSYNPGSAETEREVLEPLMRVGLLVWDDLGTGRPTDWVRETMRTVINHRYTHNRATIFSTNWPLAPSTDSRRGQLAAGDETLSERIGRRLYSRILEMVQTIQLDGPDYRLRKQSGEAKEPITTKDPAAIPADLIRCPHCHSSQVERRGTSDKGEFIESYWHCGHCPRDFLARYYPSSERVEYPRNPDLQSRDFGPLRTD